MAVDYATLGGWFSHPTYRLDADGMIVGAGAGAGAGAVAAGHADEQACVEELVKVVQRYMEHELGFERAFVDPDGEHCPIWLTRGWDRAEKLVVVCQNRTWSVPGLWSKEVSLKRGLDAGSQLPFLKEALGFGFGVIVLNANTNFTIVDQSKQPIANSATPLEHALYVYDRYISESQAQSIVLLGYGNGSTLTKAIVARNVDENRIAAVALVEASSLVSGEGDDDTSPEVADFLLHRAINWQGNQAPQAVLLREESRKLGCTCLSTGGISSSRESRDRHSTAKIPPGNVAATIAVALPSILRFFAFAISLHTQALLGRQVAASEDASSSSSSELLDQCLEDPASSTPPRERVNSEEDVARAFVASEAKACGYTESDGRARISLSDFRLLLNLG